MKKWLLIVLIAAYAGPGWAQEDEAPQEPPYVEDDSEFDMMEDAPASGNEPIDLNQTVSEPPTEPWDEEVSEDTSVVQDQEPAMPVVPEIVPEPVVTEVKPAPRVRSSNVTRPSPKGGVEYIEHPQAAKGLVMIKEDGSYVYRVNDHARHSNSGAFRFGTMDAPKISAADGTTYSEMYSSGQQPVLMFDYEWQPFQKYGKLGLQAGLGILTSSGSGRFLSAGLAGEKAQEKYTFVALPLSLGVIYRLEWLNRQWVAPYVSGGGTYIGVVEFRDDGKTPKAIGTPGFYGGGGLLLNVSALSRTTAFTLNSEYGIKNLWVSLDYRYLKTVNEDIDFSSSIIGGGLVVDY